MIVEVCANSVQSARNAQEAGADRLEICTELGIGGITPSYGLLKLMKEEVSIPMRVLIRPRSGNFTYSDSEFRVMLDDIDFCVKMGFDGIVSGVLNKDHTIDIPRTTLMVAASAGLRFTFHRAFDWVPEPLVALCELETLGVDCILTSGQEKSADLGMPMLRKLLSTAEGSTIVPAAGIRSQTALKLKEYGFSELHLSGVRLYDSQTRQAPISMNVSEWLAEEKNIMTDPEIISQVVKTVK